MQYTPQLNIPYVEPTDQVTDWPSASQSLANAVETAVLQALAQTQVAPVASVQAFAGATAPTGWLLCDGTEYIQGDYAALFAVIGQTYGGSVGNFRVPDTGGRVIIGKDGTYALNASGGATTHPLIIAELPSHNHQYNLAYSTTGTTGGATGIPGTGSAPNASFTTYTEPTGSGTPHNNMQPYRALNYIIKT
jgi:microcystin-dependent protein